MSASSDVYLSQDLTKVPCHVKPWGGNQNGKDFVFNLYAGRTGLLRLHDGETAVLQLTGYRVDRTITARVPITAIAYGQPAAPA